MSEVALRSATGGNLPNIPAPVQSEATMSLVGWAQEAEAAYSLAENLVRTPFAGSWKGDVYGGTAAILKGAEVGLTPVTALGAFDNIQGTPAPKAITLRALVQAHGHDLEIIEESDQRAVARYRRNGQGDWRTTEFTIEQARQMKLTGKDNWQKQPANMLVARVTSKAARLVAADVILGIGYSAEELRDEAPAPEARRVASQRVTADELAGTPTSGDAAGPDEEAPSGPPAAPSEHEPGSITEPQLTKLHTCLTKVALTDRDEALAYYARVTGRTVESSKDLSLFEAGQVIEDLERCERGEWNHVDPASVNDPTQDGEQ